MSSSSLVDPADMTKLARALVNPDKSVRDKTCFNLTAFFSVTSSFTDMEMLKLWKALYYCMWLSDKNEIQTELAAFLCSVVDDFPNVEISTLYIRMFFRTMLREWPLLDQHRLNKFYRLLRFMMRKIFMLLSNHKFDLKLTKSILEVLHDEVLNKVPNGVRFHLFDVFLEELYLATDGDISTSILIVLVTPLLNLLAVSRDASCQDRISKVFTSYLSTFAVENKVSLKINSSSENGTSTGMAPSLFSKVDTKALQALVFSMASDTTTLDTNRSKLYGLHKQFAAKTGMAFVEESVLLKYTALENSDDQLVEQKSMSESNKKNSDKKRPLDTHASKETNNSEPTESTTDPTSALKKKKRKSATDDSISSTIPVVAVAANNSDLTTNSTINSKNVIAKSTSKVNGPSYHSASASHSVIVDHSVDQADFIASKKFEGAKLGYAFKKGSKGVGYYIDPVQQKQMAAGATKKGKKVQKADETVVLPVKKVKLSESSSTTHSVADSPSPSTPPLSPVKKRVSFGKSQKKDYLSSVRALQSSSPVAELDRSPVKSAIKMTRSVSKK